MYAHYTVAAAETTEDGSEWGDLGVLPSEVLTVLAWELDGLALTAIARTCRAWYHFMRKNTYLWKGTCLSLLLLLLGFNFPSS